MKKNDIFRGTIIRHPKNCDLKQKKHKLIKSQPYKKNTVIIQIRRFGFVDLDSLTGNRLKDFLIICKNIIFESSIKNGIFIDQIPTPKNDLWIDLCTLQPYYHSDCNIKKVKIKQLKLNETKKDIIH